MLRHRCRGGLHFPCRYDTAEGTYKDEGRGPSLSTGTAPPLGSKLRITGTDNNDVYTEDNDVYTEDNDVYADDDDAYADDDDAYADDNDVYADDDDVYGDDGAAPPNAGLLAAHTIGAASRAEAEAALQSRGCVAGDFVVRESKGSTVISIQTASGRCLHHKLGEVGGVVTVNNKPAATAATAGGTVLAGTVQAWVSSPVGATQDLQCVLIDVHGTATVHGTVAPDLTHPPPPPPGAPDDVFTSLTSVQSSEQDADDTTTYVGTTHQAVALFVVHRTIGGHVLASRLLCRHYPIPALSPRPMPACSCAAAVARLPQNPY